MWRHLRREWAEPLAYAQAIPEREARWVLLYSGMQTARGGRYSLLGLDVREELCGGGWEVLASQVGQGRPWYENAWFGYVGYGLKNQLERVPEDRADEALSPASVLPDVWMLRFGTLVRFDHEARCVEMWAEDEEALRCIPEPVRRWEKAELAPVAELASPMTKAAYLSKVAQVVEEVHRGSLYQANVTRKFTGRFTGAVRGMDVFTRLTEVSPAPYSAYLRLGEVEIVSSSPEQFIRIEATGGMEAQPIKGTAPRRGDAGQDAQSREGLRDSAKDRSENLMIVDLMRNDLSRVCEPGSVGVEELFAIRSYATVHHMVSRISGRKIPTVSAVEAVKACFPPGSMTGAPKIRAMTVCSQMEELRRGVYAGAIGWFGGDGSCELSVVIRTLVKCGERFEFQVGGGIVADSRPEAEWEETLVKARGIAAALGIEEEALRRL